MTNPERMEERRRSVLLAAAQVFADQGYQTATVGDIAEKLGTSRGVIYYQFRSKEDIIAELRIIVAEDSIANFESILARGEPPETTLRLAIRDLINWSFVDLNRHSILLPQPADINAAHREAIRDAERRYFRLFHRVLEEGIRVGVFVDRNPTLMTHAIIRAGHSPAFWYQPNGPLRQDEVVEQLTDQLVVGVLRTPAGPSRNGQRLEGPRRAADRAPSAVGRRSSAGKRDPVSVGQAKQRPQRAGG